LPLPSAGRGRQVVDSMTLNQRLQASDLRSQVPRLSRLQTLLFICMTLLVLVLLHLYNTQTSSFTLVCEPRKITNHAFRRSRALQILFARRRYCWHRDASRTPTGRDLPSPQDTQSDYRPPIFQTPSRPSSPDRSTPVDTNPSLTQTSSSGAVHVCSATTSASVEPIHSASSGMNIDE